MLQNSIKDAPPVLLSFFWMIREAKFSNTSSSLSLATFSLDETGVSSVSHGKGASQSSRTSKEDSLLSSVGEADQEQL